MIEQYLIAHIARGQPSFDIAEREGCPHCQGGIWSCETEHGWEESACVECDGTGWWWILSTCGYRAYPYYHIEMRRLQNGGLLIIEDLCPTFPPPDAIDCFACNDRPSTTTLATGAKALLARLGLVKKPAPIVRRL